MVFPTFEVLVLDEDAVPLVVDLPVVPAVLQLRVPLGLLPRGLVLGDEVEVGAAVEAVDRDLAVALPRHPEEHD